MKHLEGKTVYMVPTGNNVGRTKPLTEQVMLAHIDKVARVKVTFRKVGWNWPQVYRFKKDSNRIEVENAGYLIFEDEQELYEFFHKKDLKKLLMNASLNFSNTLERLSIETLELLCRELGLEVSSNGDG